MPREEVRRLFFALWPTDAVRAQIRDRAQPIAAASRGRLVPPANLHATVLFLGEVLETRVEAVLRSGAEVSGTIGTFELWLDQIESWPGSKVLCLTAAATPPALLSLADRLRISLLAQQFKLQRQVLRPHVTLVRHLPRLRPAVSAPLVRWCVDDFVLVDSQVSRAGSTYTVIGRWLLGTGPSSTPTKA